jgi:hypothetical protein
LAARDRASTAASRGRHLLVSFVAPRHVHDGDTIPLVYEADTPVSDAEAELSTEVAKALHVTDAGRNELVKGVPDAPAVFFFERADLIERRRPEL